MKHQFWGTFIVATSLLLGGVAPALAEGKVVDYIEPKNANNPPPAVTLNTFQRFEVAPIVMEAPYAGQEPNEVARHGIQTNLDLRLKPVLEEWNGKAVEGTPRTLRIEPKIEHVKFIGGAARFWGGAFAGGSGVLMTVKLSDAATGEVIAQPEFYQHANKMAGAWSFGATDRAMLIRVSSMIVEYLQKNYAEAVGGSTTVAGDVKF